MRHGRLASALVLAAFTGLAAGQSPTSEFAIDREPVAPAPSPTRIAPAVLALPIPIPAAPIAADQAAPSTDKAPDKVPPTTDKAAPTADKVPMPIPPSAGGAATPPTVSALPPNGIVLPPNGGTVLLGEGTTAMDPSRYWVSAECLAWKIKKDSTPPLVTTGPATFPVAFLGNPGTRVLFGGEIDPGTFSGVRLSAGLWLDDCHTCGLEVSGFWLKEKDTSAAFNSNQFPVLARPFRDVNPGGQNSEFLAFPRLSTGAVTIKDPIDFCGVTVAARCPVWGGCYGQIDGLAGLQFLRLKENLTIVETPRGSATNPFPGGANTQFIATDSFRTENRFYGAFVGADAHTNYGCWIFGLNASVGVGCNRETVEISGSQVTIPATGAATTVNGGLLAVPGANIGRFTKNEFSVVPQLGLTVGYQLTECIQVFGGYTCLYWTNVVRPGSEIDPVLNVNRIPNFGGGPAATSNRPIVPFDQTNFWAQGISVGVKFSW